VFKIDTVRHLLLAEKQSTAAAFGCGAARRCWQRGHLYLGWRATGVAGQSSLDKNSL